MYEPQILVFQNNLRTCTSWYTARRINLSLWGAPLLELHFLKNSGLAVIPKQLPFSGRPPFSSAHWHNTRFSLFYTFVPKPTVIHCADNGPIISFGIPYSKAFPWSPYTHVHTHCPMRIDCDRSLNVCRNVSHRSKNKWEISPFSGKILRVYGSGDHHKISYKQKMFFNGQKREGKLWKNASFYWTFKRTGEMRCNILLYYRYWKPSLSVSVCLLASTLVRGQPDSISSIHSYKSLPR